MRCNIPERMNNQQKWEQLRSQTSTVACYSIMIALRMAMGIGKERQRNIIGHMERVQTEYAESIHSRRGKPEAERARNLLMQQVEPYAPTEMRWPALIKDSTPRKDWSRLRDEQSVRDDVATLSWCMYARCIREELGWGRKRFSQLLENAEDILTKLLEKAETEEGTDWEYLMTLIQRNIEAVVDDAKLTEVTEEEMHSRGQNWVKACTKKAAIKRLNAGYDKLIRENGNENGVNVLSPRARAMEGVQLNVRIDRALAASGMERRIATYGKRKG